jgi:cell division inhibitor SepF
MGFFQRLREVLGLDDLYDDYDYEGYEGNGISPAAYPSGRASKPIGMPALPPGQSEMILLQPQSFDEMPDAVAALRERRSVILDLTMIDAEHAQRCADYVAGGAFAMDGHYRQLGAGVFLFTPNSVYISHRAPIEEPAPQAPPPKKEPTLSEATKLNTPRRSAVDPSTLWNMP